MTRHHIKFGRKPPPLWPLVWILVLLALAVSEKSDARTSLPLATVASVFAQQEVVVECATLTEDPTLVWAWGYVYLYTNVIHTSEYLCSAAENVNNPAYGDSVKALAVSVLIHEAYHLRRSWSSRGNEAKTQCKAIRHFRYGAMMLGASPAYATQLRAYALAWHWKLAAKIPEYHLAGCKVPRP